MGCLNLGFIEELCIMIVIIIAAWQIVQLLLPYLLQFLPGLVVGLIKIVIWAIVAIFIIKVIFDLIGCLFGGGSGGLHLSLH
jgi:hypothetical protein